jgi:hypothetical protein
MKDQCAIYFGQILMIDAAGVFLQEVQVILLVKTSQNNSTIQIV